MWQRFVQEAKPDLQAKITTTVNALPAQSPKQLKTAPKHSESVGRLLATPCAERAARAKTRAAIDMVVKSDSIIQVTQLSK
jgi:hypothetical protein